MRRTTLAMTLTLAPLLTGCGAADGDQGAAIANPAGEIRGESVGQPTAVAVR